MQSMRIQPTLNDFNIKPIAVVVFNAHINQLKYKEVGTWQLKLA